MAGIQVIGGAFNAFFIGQAGVSNIALTRINQIGAGDYNIGFIQPKARWVRAVNAFLPSALPSFTLSTKFFSDDPNAWIIGMSNWFGDNLDQPPKGIKYQIFLYDSINVNTQSSIYVPTCDVDVDMKLIRGKKVPADISLSFRWTAPLSSQMFYKRTAAQIKTILGPASPI